MRTLLHHTSDLHRTRRELTTPRCALAARLFFQPPDRELPGESSARRPRELRAFRTLAENYFRSEAPAQQRAELLLFVVLVAISCCPVAMAIKLAVAAATW